MLRLTGLADSTAPAVLQEVSHGEKKLKLATDSKILWFCGPSFTDCPHFPFESFPYSEKIIWGRVRTSLLHLFKEETTWARDSRASLMILMGQGAKDTLRDGRSQNPKQNIVHFTGCGLKPESDRTLT